MDTLPRCHRPSVLLASLTQVSGSVSIYHTYDEGPGGGLRPAAEVSLTRRDDLGSP